MQCLTPVADCCNLLCTTYLQGAPSYRSGCGMPARPHSQWHLLVGKQSVLLLLTSCILIFLPKLIVSVRWQESSSKWFKDSFSKQFPILPALSASLKLSFGLCHWLSLKECIKNISHIKQIATPFAWICLWALPCHFLVSPIWNPVWEIYFRTQSKKTFASLKKHVYITGMLINM